MGRITALLFACAILAAVARPASLEAQPFSAVYSSGLSIGMPSGLSLSQGAELRSAAGPVVGLVARVPVSSFRLLFPSSDEAAGFSTDSFRMFDVDCGLYCGWAFGRGGAWEEFLGVELGGLVSYRSTNYRDATYGYGGQYSSWSWLQEARLLGSASVSLGSLTGLRAIEPLRLGFSAGIPLRGPWYILERYSIELEASWRFASPRRKEG